MTRPVEGIFDIEADGLLDTITKVHQLSITFRDENKRVISHDRFVGHKAIKQGLAKLDECDTIVGHNIIGFDLLALWQVMRYKPKAKNIVDTMTLSCLVHPDVYGGHSLEAWGERVGEPKTDYQAAYIEWRQEQEPSYTYTKGDEWIEWNPIMGDYCDQDVKVNVKVYDQLRKDMEGWDWKVSEWCEHQFAKYFARQGWRGVMVDRAHTERCVSQWEQEMASIEAEVEPLLPPRKGTLGQLRSSTPPKLQFKKNGEPSAACEAWFDELKEVGGSWQGLKYGEWHSLPTPMTTDEEGNEVREPLITEFPMKLADQEEIKAWLMYGQPTEEAKQVFTDIRWEPE